MKLQSKEVLKIHFAYLFSEIIRNLNFYIYTRVY